MIYRQGLKSECCRMRFPVLNCRPWASGGWECDWGDRFGSAKHHEICILFRSLVRSHHRQSLCNFFLWVAPVIGYLIDADTRTLPPLMTRRLAIETGSAVHDCGGHERPGFYWHASTE